MSDSSDERDLENVIPQGYEGGDFVTDEFLMDAPEFVRKEGNLIYMGTDVFEIVSRDVMRRLYVVKRLGRQDERDGEDRR